MFRALGLLGFEFGVWGLELRVYRVKGFLGF